MTDLSPLSSLTSPHRVLAPDTGAGSGGPGSEFAGASLSGPSRAIVPYHIDDLLRLAKEKGASDVRITGSSAPRITISGVNQTAGTLGLEEAAAPLLPHQAQELVYSMLSKNDQIRLETTGDADLSYAVRMANGSLQNFRVNAFRERHGYGAVIRVLEPIAPDLTALFQHDKGAIQIFERLFTQHEGLVLVTGPTGSGKSTTIAAMLQHQLDNNGGSLVSLEQPIEFYIQEKNAGTSVIQREVGRDTETFETGLRAALREAPNIILVGEMRDKVSVEGALQAAQTGHLVVATLHTNSAKDTLHRLINAVGSENRENVQTQLSQSLIGIVSQQLLHRAQPLKDGPLYARERIAVPEILLMTPAISNLIRTGKVQQIDNQLQISAGDGMRTRNQSLDLYVKSNLVTKAEADRFRKSSQD